MALDAIHRELARAGYGGDHRKVVDRIRALVDAVEYGQHELERWQGRADEVAVALNCDRWSVVKTAHKVRAQAAVGRSRFAWLAAAGFGEEVRSRCLDSVQAIDRAGGDS